MAIEPGPQFEHRGQHQPGADGAPLHDLLATGHYPKDIYQNLHHVEGSQSTRRLIAAVRGNPNAMIPIYRSVPHDASRRQWLGPQLKEATEEHAEFLKTGRLPEWASYHKTPEEYSSWITHNISMLKEAYNAEEPKPITTINYGDWVTLDKSYADRHGEGRTGGHKTLSMTVPASHLRNDGNDFNEWGYFPPQEDRQ